MRSSSRVTVVLACALASANAAFGIAACSSSSPEGDGSADATAETGSDRDATDDTPPVDRPDATPARDGGHCSAVTGPCDLVLQDCPDKDGKKQECVVTGSAASMTTACVAVQASQQLPKGRACCPPTQGAPDNPCLPGLTCVGNPCTDGGPPSGRCTPACCEGDDQACGQSDPEGIAGACDIVLVDTQSSQEITSVCSYRERCKPFGIEPCKAGEVCLIEDKIGTSSCLTSFGKEEGEPCSFANECADGLMCIGSADAGTCHYQCLIPGAVSPYDASIEDDPPGKGGCPAGQECNIGFSNLPSWLGACGDGGS